VRGEKFQNSSKIEEKVKEERGIINNVLCHMTKKAMREKKNQEIPGCKSLKVALRW
jgi:hypothetical protein